MTWPQPGDQWVDSRTGVGAPTTGLRPHWLAAIRRYLVASAIGQLAWEIAQLPLYTLWRSAPVDQIVRAVLHCWAGDLAIASTALTLALAIIGTREWPARHMFAVCGITVALSLAYTTYSEYVNTVTRQSWSYAAAMPTVMGIGLSPLAQWVIVPVAAFIWATRSATPG